MSFSKLNNNVSSDDIERTKDIRNPPEFEPGFEGGDDDGFGDLFDDFEFDDLGGDFGSDSGGGSTGGTDDIFGGTSGGFGDTNKSFGGATGGFGSSPGGFGSSFGGSPFGGIGQQQQAPPKEDAMDKAFKVTGEAAESFGKTIKEMVESLGNRNADDMGYLSRNLIITGGIILGSSTLLSIIGAISNVGFIRLTGISGQLMVASILVVGTSVAGLAIAASAIAKANNNESSGDIEKLEDVRDFMDSEDDFTLDYEENIESILDDLFDDDDLFEDLEDEEDIWQEEDNYEPDLSNVSFEVEKIDYEEQLSDVFENQVISRERLFNTFKEFFPLSTPTFSDKTEIYEGSEEFATVETICLKALSNVCKCEMEDVKSKLETLVETHFSYEMRMKRVRGVNKVDDIAREMEAYFRENSRDTGVNATVDIEGDFYKIVVTKGEKAIVTFGDVFRQQEACDFFLNTKNQLPMIVGIDELGGVILEDAKPFDSMMIAGKPRSGKSWYVLSVMASLMMFNSPEDVQFIICDPKKSTLFNTLALMPHVAGLNDDENILEVMKDIIDKEGERRKKLLADNRCEDIWALRKKGIRLPILYLVIDEVITVKSNLESKGEKGEKEFDSLMQVMISQLPFVGIRLIFVPHRATGVVNKTNRTMLQYTAAVRSNPEDVCDTLNIKRWDRSLVHPGDTAVKYAGTEDASYVRGASITTSDDENAELIKNAARAFYKMGVDVPDMGALTDVSVNRDEEYIRQELDLNNSRVQYDASNILKDLN